MTAVRESSMRWQAATALWNARLTSKLIPSRMICASATAAETRQVFDLPSMRYEVTEHHVLEARCACGKRHRGEFPEGVNAPVQYGPRVKAAAVHLSQHHMLPAQRTADLMGDLTDLPLSDATVLAAVAEARERLEPH